MELSSPVTGELTTPKFLDQRTETNFFHRLMFTAMDGLVL